MSLLEQTNIAIRAASGVTLADALWYLFLAGIAWLMFYVLFPRFFRRRRVADVDPTRQQIAREIFHSLRSLAIFGLFTIAMVVAAINGWTRIYVDDPRYGAG